MPNPSEDDLGATQFYAQELVQAFRDLEKAQRRYASCLHAFLKSGSPLPLLCGSQKSNGPWHVIRHDVKYVIRYDVNNNIIIDEHCYNKTDS